MKIIKDRQLIYDVYNYDIVLVSMGLNNSFNCGLRYELNLNFHGLKEKEIESGYGDKRKCGTVFSVKTDKVIFCMCYMFTGWNRHKNDKDYVNYENLDSCLYKITELYGNKKIASPLLGLEPCDGNGNRQKIEYIFNKHFAKMDNVFLYDYKQRDYRLEIFHKLAEIHNQLKTKKITKEEYVRLRRNIEWERIHGVLNPIPEDYEFVPQRKRIKKAKIQEIDGYNQN